MSTLYIRLPSKAAADSSSNWLSLACPFALLSNSNAIEHQGTAPLPDLSDAIEKSQRMVVLLSASDVSLHRVQVPPLSPTKLKAALPNLVEEQLISDPSDCVMISGGVSDGLLTIAVIQHAWLDRLIKTLLTLGAHHISALPAQLCLPYTSGNATAAVTEQVNDIDLTLRLSEQEGIGLTIRHENEELAASAAIRALCAVIPEAPITLFVPPPLVQAYQDAINATNTDPGRINISSDDWTKWINGAKTTTIDMATGLGLGTGPKMEWRPWRLPLALAATVLLINIGALNIDWWRMKSESNALRASMVQIYKSAYPKESVIIDPIAQMQQKITAAKRNSGQAAPHDFTVLTASFGEAWNNAFVAAKKSTSISALEYRDQSLFVHLKTGSEAPTQQMKTELARRDLTLELAPEKSGMTVWKIGSAR